MSHRDDIRQAFRTGLVVAAAMIGVGSANAQVACTIPELEGFLSQIRTADSPVGVTVSPVGPQYVLDKTVRITVQSPFDARLLLISVDSENNVYPIYPNTMTEPTLEGWISAGVPITLPPDNAAYEFSVQRPTGPSRLIAIAWPRETKRFPLPCAEPLTKGVDQTLRSVNVELEAEPEEDAQEQVAPTGTVPEPLPGWAMAEFHYEVVAAGK